MEIGIAKQLLADPRALHEKTDVELVGHTHAAMHLHALLHRARRGGARAPLTTASGFMAGRYQMVSETGERFEIDVPTFSLDCPDRSRVLN